MKSEKYILRWQIARIQAKKVKNIDTKIFIIKKYFRTYPSLNDKDRVLNWIDGSIIGYKDITSKRKLGDFKIQIENTEVLPIDFSDSHFAEYNEKTLIELVKDLYKRNKKWADKGYIHKSQVEFLTKLYNFLEECGIVLPSAFNKATFEQDTKIGSSIPNTHKFLY
jgi:hypothetical protein